MKQIKDTWKATGTYSKATLKKAVAIAAAGAFVAFGIGMAQLPQSVALAATQNGTRADRDYRWDFSPEQAAESMQEAFGVDKQAILDYNQKGWRFRDLDRASFIAFVSQKPLGEVLDAKTVTNTWRDVSDSFGITPEQYRAARGKLMSAQMARDLQIDQSTIEQLLKDGYHPRDIETAALLSKEAGKSFNDVLTMKKINNTWFDVASSLGLSEQSFYDCMNSGRDGYYGYGHYRGDHRGGYYHNRGWHNGPRA